MKKLAVWIPGIANCWIFAVVNRFKYGGKIVVGKSHYGWWPHVEWRDKKGIIWEYVPPSKVRCRGWKNIIPIRALLFRGHIEIVGKVCHHPCDIKEGGMKPSWLVVAEGEIGTKEIAGPADNPRILEYHSATTLHASDDETPWCSAFVNWCLQETGFKNTGLANARSFLQYGEQLKMPFEGCVVVLKRGAPPSGHVGFFIARLPGGWIKVLGGNQGDQVKYSNFKEDDVLGYRWPMRKEEA